jgi:SAM-dependent methyltransferase
MYSLIYRFGKPRWNTNITPPEVIEAFGELPEVGTALDLGCGTGTNVIYIAQHGWQAIGVDFVGLAVNKAKRKAEKYGLSQSTTFYHADVTRLANLDLPTCQYALDMGCFHGQNRNGQRAYIDALAKILAPCSQYMLYAFKPTIGRGGAAIGLTIDEVRGLFSPFFNIERFEEDDYSVWYWMRKKTE